MPCAYTLQEVADVAGLHYSTVSRIAKRMAALRDGGGDLARGLDG